MPYFPSIGDVYILTTLAYRVFTSLRDAPAELNHVMEQVKGIQLVVLSLGKLLKGLELNQEHSSVLEQLLEDCRKPLKQLKTHLQSYQSIAAGELSIRRGCETARWEFNSDMRRELHSSLERQVQLLTSFQSTIAIWSLAEIKQKLSKLLHESEEGSTIAESSSLIGDNNGQTWPQLCQELISVGIKREVIEVNQPFFIGWIATAISLNEERASQQFDKEWKSPIEDQESLREAPRSSCSLCARVGHNMTQCLEATFIPSKSIIANFDDIQGGQPMASISTTSDSSSFGSTPLSPTSSGRWSFLNELGDSPNLANGLGVGYGPSLSSHTSKSNGSRGGSLSIPTSPIAEQEHWPSSLSFRGILARYGNSSRVLAQG